MAATHSEQSLSVTQLCSRLGVDIVSAGSAALAITPAVCLIDSIIMLRAASSCSLKDCMRVIMSPLSKLPRALLLSPQARLVFLVYFGTYTTANSVDTLTSFKHSLPATTVTASTSKFIGTAAVSTALTVYKDSRMAQIFRRGGVATTVPLMTYSLFTIRDAITIFASFNLPTIIAPHLPSLSSQVSKNLEDMLKTESARLKTAQFLLPVMIQTITTPIHLFGLEFYNRRHATPVAERSVRVVKDMGLALPARMARIIPAFGIGGVLNTSARSTLMDKLV